MPVWQTLEQVTQLCKVKDIKVGMHTCFNAIYVSRENSFGSRGTFQEALTLMEE
jgi:hypothetical protein